VCRVAVASQAALELVQTDYPYLVVLRDMPIPGETEDEAEIAELTTEVSFLEGLPELMSKNFGKSALVFPIKNVFDRIELGIDLVEIAGTSRGLENVTLQTRQNLAYGFYR